MPGTSPPAASIRHPFTHRFALDELAEDDRGFGEKWDGALKFVSKF
jgi:hypothetical protein